MKVGALFLANLLGAFLVLAAGISAWVIYELPSVAELERCIVTNMNKVRLCEKSNDYTLLNDISPHLIDSLIVAEDASFYNHDGFNFEEISNSLKKNISTKGFARGGSTISQQLVKNVFLTGEKTISRKFKEAVLTYLVEDKYSKKFILEKYLNVVEFGENVYGVQRASQYYFFKQPSDLSVVESAFLVHLLPSPKKYSQNFIRGYLSEFNKARIKTIVEFLYTFKKIDEEEYQIANENMSSLFEMYSKPEEVLSGENPASVETNEAQDEISEEDL